MKYTLPPLPYNYGALEPYIDALTMEIHHNKHQQAYVNNLNKALENYPNLQEKTLEWLLTHLQEIPEEVRTAIKNNGGGQWNHSFFWPVMSPKGGGQPKGMIAQAIKKRYGTFEAFQADFNAKAKGVFGSGWAWLCVANNGEIVVNSTANQDCPITNNLHPVLGLDVWEHAYYLQYQNRRPDYITAWWHVINWPDVEEQYRMVLDNL